ncbi:MAG: MFS transporter [Bacteroidetes bacterium]|nr:MFS transporter [Bacteroidota bacterium]
MKAILALYKESFSAIQRNIWVLSIAMFINRSGSMVLLFTSLYLTKELHFTIAEAGLALSFYGIGSVLGSYAGGWLTDRYHFYNIMFYSLISSGFILLLLLAAKTPIFISSVIFIYAFAADIFRPANSKAIAAYSSPENRTRSVSLVRLAVNLGFSVGPAVGGFIALYLGYKLLFVIDAITSVAAAGLLFMYLPKKELEQSKVTSAEIKDSSPSAYRDIPYLVFILLVALYGVCFFQLFASIPQYFDTVCNYSEDTIGLLLGLNGLLVVLIEMPLVTYLEKEKKLFRYIIIGVLCLPVSFAILKFGEGMLLPAIAYTVIITLSEIYAMPFMMNYSLSRPKKERQGQYSALYSIAYGVSNIVAPVLGLGLANRYGFNTMFYVLIGLSILAAIGFILLSKKKKPNIL